MCAINGKIPKWQIDNTARNLERLSDPGYVGTWHTSLVEIHAEGPGAVAVLNEDVKDRKPSFDIDPLYLVRLDGRWWILPDMTRYDAASPLLSAEDYAVYDSLEKWYKAREQELMYAQPPRR